MRLRHDTVQTGTAGAAKGTMCTTAEVRVQRSMLLQLEQNTVTQRRTRSTTLQPVHWLAAKSRRIAVTGIMCMLT
jgi:hypothetical protein